MTATLMTHVKPRPAHRGPRSAGRGQAASCAGDPALGDQSRERTEESAGEKSQSGPRPAQEHAPRQPARQLTPAEQHDLAARIKAGDQVAREALIVANLRLVANIARRYYSYGATLDDLIQEGSRGLIYAVERYDPETHNTRFSTYASYWIRNTIQRAIAANFSLIRVPDYMFRLNVRSHQVGGEPRTEDRPAPDDRGSAALGSRLEISHRQRQLLNHSIDVIRNKGYNSRMMTYARLQSDRREFLALTGLTFQEFQLLLNAFTPAYERRYPKDRTLADRPRQRCAGGGRKGVLDCPEQKLLFLLVYLKTYPLQVLMGELFSLSQPGVNYWIHRLLPVLRDALDSLSVLPERNPNDFARSQTATGTEPRLIIDGTERRRQRPKSPEKQALHYSGKKKAHTDKNVVIVDLRRKCIGFLSRTYVGKTHDKKIADSEGISYPPKAELYKDTGFQGYEPAVTRTCQAKKKAAPRGTHSR